MTEEKKITNIHMNKERLLSLDAFRGLTIAGMILVNNPGSWSHVYPPLLHAKWHGCTPTDLVFPFFLFIVGVSLSYSYSSFNYQFSGKALKKLLKRVALIFLIGLLLNAFPFYNMDIFTLRILGVLQRIALAFGLAGLLILLLNRWQLIVSAIAMLLGYWFVLWYFGGDAPYELESNVVRNIDIAIFTENHIYQGFGIPFEPEGLLSTITSAVTVIYGFLVGLVLRKKSEPAWQNLLYISGAGAVMILLALLWGQVFPINKPIWTSSYVLYTGGIASILLSLFYWLIDVIKWRKWAQFFVVYGVNPLFGYALSVVWVKILFNISLMNPETGEMTNGYTWLYSTVFAPVFGNLNGSLMFALFHIIIFWLILFILYKRKIFIKI